MAIGHFTNAKPRRLYREASNWVLEVERLLPLDDRVLRPQRQKLVGVDVVLYQLANSDEGRGLLSDARRLMVDNAPDDAAYEAEEGRWIPAAFLAQVSPRRRQAPMADEPAEGAGAARGRGASLNGAQLEVHLLREELRELRAAHEKLQRRVGQLEKGGLVVTHQHAEAKVDPKAKAQAAAPVAEAKPAEAKILKAAYAISLPSPDAIEGQISAMIGDRSGLLPSKKPMDLSARHLFVSILADDAHNPVGAMVASLECVVRQGAGLMLLPEHEISEQLRTRKPSDAVTEAMGEIMNVCAAAFNAVPDNLHVRALPLEALSLETHAWLKSTGPRLDLADPNGAALSFVLRGEGT